jgi:hypothetical protein
MKPMSCSTTTTERVLAISFAIGSPSRRLGIGHAGTGSSTSRSFGSCASSMPISSHCFWPCERLAASSSAAVRQRIVFEDLFDARAILGRQP